MLQREGGHLLSLFGDCLADFAIATRERLEQGRQKSRKLNISFTHNTKKKRFLRRGELVPAPTDEPRLCEHLAAAYRQIRSSAARLRDDLRNHRRLDRDGCNTLRGEVEVS